jgi:hypothetical protein
MSQWRLVGGNKTYADRATALIGNISCEYHKTGTLPHSLLMQVISQGLLCSESPDNPKSSLCACSDHTAVAWEMDIINSG